MSTITKDLAAALKAESRASALTAGRYLVVAVATTGANSTAADAAAHAAAGRALHTGRVASELDAAAKESPPTAAKPATATAAKPPTATAAKPANGHAAAAA